MPTTAWQTSDYFLIKTQLLRSISAASLQSPVLGRVSNLILCLWWTGVLEVAVCLALKLSRDGRYPQSIIKRRSHSVSGLCVALCYVLLTVRWSSNCALLTGGQWWVEWVIQRDQRTGRRLLFLFGTLWFPQKNLTCSRKRTIVTTGPFGWYPTGQLFSDFDWYARLSRKSVQFFISAH